MGRKRHNYYRYVKIRPIHYLLYFVHIQAKNILTQLQLRTQISQCTCNRKPRGKLQTLPTPHPGLSRKKHLLVSSSPSRYLSDGVYQSGGFPWNLILGTAKMCR